MQLSLNTTPKMFTFKQRVSFGDSFPQHPPSSSPRAHLGRVAAQEMKDVIKRAREVLTQFYADSGLMFVQSRGAAFARGPAPAGLPSRAAMQPLVSAHRSSHSLSECRVRRPEQVEGRGHRHLGRRRWDDRV